MLLRGPAAALCAALLASAAPPELTAEQRAGRTIYFDGTSPSGGEITAIVGDAVLPGSALPCASCHGADGLGRAEGGVLPPEITWRSLTKSYGHDHRGRRHAAFDERSVARAISEGVDPSQNVLDPAMPRYSLSRDDLHSLVAYLKVLEREAEPGVSATTVHLGTVLPTRGRLASLGRSMRGVLESYLAELNARGGIHGRTIAMSVAEFDADIETAADALTRLLATRPLFALVSGFTPRGEDAVAAIAARDGIPWIAPLANPAPTAGPRTFYALGGPREQARALAAYTSRKVRRGGTPVVVLQARGGHLASAAEAARAQLAAAGGLAAVREFGSEEIPQLARELAREGVDTVLLLGTDAHVAALAKSAREESWSPLLLASGTLSARGALGEAQAFREVRVAFPSAPTDGTAEGRVHYARLVGDAAVTPGDRHAQAAAYVAAALIAEGLRRAGRHLTRGALVEHLESLQRFAPGVGPPLSYGPSRRIGALGAWIVAARRDGTAFEQDGEWVALE